MTVDKKEVTKESWDFNKKQTVLELNELVFVSNLGDNLLLRKRCEELSAKYSAKVVHFENCARTKSNEEIDELAEILTSISLGKRPK